MRESKDYKYCVVSYPKCGRTWLRQIEKQYCKLTNQSPLTSIYTHLNHGIGQGGEEPRIKYLKNNPDVPKFLLTRDPADTLVSYYHDDVVRGKGHKYRSTSEGVDKYCKKNLKDLKNFYSTASEYEYSYVFSYEDMLSDTFHTLLPMFEVIYKDLDHEAFREAIKYCEFSNLSKLERDGKVDMKVVVGHQRQGFYKTRKGKAGSAKEELKAETLDWIEENL